jgi:hypothetical protein
VLYRETHALLDGLAEATIDGAFGIVELLGFAAEWPN